MKAYKEKQYLVFRFDDGKDVRYNLATGETIGKLGRPVSSIAPQLRGHNILSVINSFEDENYKAFLQYIDLNFINKSTARNSNSIPTLYNRVSKIRNLGSFLSMIDQYSKFEQYFSSGLRKINRRITTPITSVPRGLIAFCKQFDVELTDDLVVRYKENHNDYHNLTKEEYTTLNVNRHVVALLTESTTSYTYGSFHILVRDYGYEKLPLLRYIDHLMTYEAIDDFSFILRELRDYARMMSEISPRFDKYPRNFLTTHRIASRNYSRLKAQFEEEEFKHRIDTSLEYKRDGFVVLYPSSTQDIKDEAVQQNNCVSSYIQSVMDGKCHILFMRYAASEDSSLVTLEVRGNRVVQARGKFNREVTPQERDFIEKYNARLEKKERQELRNVG